MPNVTPHKLTCTQRRALEAFGERISRFGVNFAVVDADGQIVVLLNAGAFESDTQPLIEAGKRVFDGMAQETPDTGEIPVWQFAADHLLVAAPLSLPPIVSGHRRPAGVVIVDLGDPARQPSDFVSPGALVSGPHHCQADYFSEMLRLLACDFQTGVRTDEQMETFGTELSQVYEELVLLHRISTNMRVTESDTNFLQLACDSLTDIVQVEGIGILLDRQVEGEKRLVVAAGSGLIDLDEGMAAMLHSRLADEVRRGQEALLDSEVDTPFAYDWPDTIRNIIAVPLCATENGDVHAVSGTKASVAIIGLMVAVNRVDKADFDSTDIKLFTSVASGCAVFIENGRLFNDLKELFVGSLKALTSSIDAKDQYTRGHSERVAIISRWVAERVAEKQPLAEEQIHRIYLAGLLHDIGKIGIDEGVLRKNGKLTPEERECIKRHPSIGGSILRGIKQMHDIVPGVMCHHERIDGKGYPEGLRGDAIPLTGKIVGLADSFDAMTSKRTYRDAMSVEDALEEVKKGLGTQFDEEIGQIFLASDIYHLWDIIQGGGAQVYSMAPLTDYGTAAVGTLLR